MYTHDKTLAVPFEEAARRTHDALARHGFGVLTEIDALCALVASGFGE